MKNPKQRSRTFRRKTLPKRRIRIRSAASLPASLRAVRPAVRGSADITEERNRSENVPSGLPAAATHSAAVRTASALLRRHPRTRTDSPESVSRSVPARTFRSVSSGKQEPEPGPSVSPPSSSATEPELRSSVTRTRVTRGNPVPSRTPEPVRVPGTPAPPKTRSFRASSLHPEGAHRLPQACHPSPRGKSSRHFRVSGTVGTADTVPEMRKRTFRARAARLAAKTRKRAAGILRRSSAKTKLLLLLSASGGALLLVAVLAACGAFGGILSSSFGLFFSNRASENAMTELIRSVDSAFNAETGQRIAQLSADNPADEVRITFGGDADGDSAAVNNWNDVLAVYAVYTTTRADSPKDVLTVDTVNASALEQVFRAMNSVTFSVSVQKTSDPSSGTERTTLFIHVAQHSLTYRQGAEQFGFDDRQTALLEEMMSSEYDAYYASLIGVDVSGGTDLTQLVSGLPAGGRGSEIVRAALTKLGAPYVLGAKGEKKFDCSGLVYWSVRQVDAAAGAKLYTNAAGQARYLINLGRTVGRSELVPGDLVFWQNLRCSGCGRYKEIHHTGIYAGNGKVIEASSSRGRVVVRDLWSSSNYPLYCFCRVF